MLIALTAIAVAAFGLIGLWATGLWALPMLLFYVIFTHANAFYGVMTAFVLWWVWQRRRDAKDRPIYPLDLDEIERFRQAYLRRLRESDIMTRKVSR